MLSNCGCDEKGKFVGGKSGDQTGKEYYLRPYYNHNWNVVLRYPNNRVRQKIASIASEFALNDLIGYDQSQRDTLFQELVNVNFDPKKLRNKCEADCSSSTCAVLITVGHALHIQKLRGLFPFLTTRNLRKNLVTIGFDELTDRKYLTSERFLLNGDIVLCEGHHVAIYVTDGIIKKNKQIKNDEYEIGNTYQILCNALNVRKNPKIENNVIDFYTKNDAIEVLETRKIDNRIWIRSKKGWICARNNLGGLTYVG